MAFRQFVILVVVVVLAKHELPVVECAHLHMLVVPACTALAQSVCCTQLLPTAYNGCSSVLGPPVVLNDMFKEVKVPPVSHRRLFLAA